MGARNVSDTQDLEQVDTLADEIGNAFDEAEESVEELEATETEAVEEVEVLDPIEPPQMWGKEYRQVFEEWGQLENGRKYQEAMANLYRDIQGYTTQREQEAAQYRREVEQWHGAFEHHRDWIAQNGLTPQDAARKGVGVLMQIAQDPQRFATQILDKIGFDYGNYGNDQPYIPPEVASLQQQVQQLNQALQQNQQQAFQQQVTGVQQRIESFATETDENGNLLRPHFDQLQNYMAGLINAGIAQDLPDAYEKAMHLNPDIRGQEEQSRAASEAARKAAEAKKAKQAAKRPAGKHSGSDAPKRSVREDIEALYDQMST